MQLDEVPPGAVQHCMEHHLNNNQAACFEDGGAHIARKGPVQQPRHLGKLLAAHRCLAVGLEHLHFAEGEAPWEAELELNPVSIFPQVTQYQLHREAGRGGQMQGCGSGGKIREKLWGPNWRKQDKRGTLSE